MKLWLIIAIKSEYHILEIYERFQAAEGDLLVTIFPHAMCVKRPRVLPSKRE